MWREHTDAAAVHTLFHQGESWYTGSNIAGKHRQFMVHMGGSEYFKFIDKVAADDYQGFTLA